MKYEKSGEFGKWKIEINGLKGSGAEDTENFLKELIGKIIRRSAKFYKASKRANQEIPDHIFGYSEKQFNSVVCPAIARIADYFIIEYPLRGESADPELYIDYWIYYEKYKYTFMLELKHYYFNYTAKNPSTKEIAKRLDKALKQLENSKERLKNSKSRLKKYCVYGSGLRQIALEVIVFYKKDENKRKLKFDGNFKEIEKKFKWLLKNTKLKDKTTLARKSNTKPKDETTLASAYFHALWKLKKKLVEPIEDETNDKKVKFYLYPAVVFIGYISDPIK